MIAKDFPEHQKLLVAATKVYYVKIWTFDPFPDDKLQAQWALDSWDAVSDGLTLPNDQAGAMIRYVSNSLYVQPPPTDAGLTRLPDHLSRLERSDPFEG